MHKHIKNTNWASTFTHACHGIRDTIKTERNFKVHLIAGIVAIGACVFFAIPPWQFALVGVAIFLVLITELMNTAIEATIDLVCDGKIHPLAKKAKDAAAAAVLMAAVFALGVGAIIAASILKGM